MPKKNDIPVKPVMLVIEVPQEHRKGFWSRPQDKIHYWAFKNRPRAFLNEQIIFTFNRKPVAQAVVLKIEGPGKGQGEYKQWHKVFWHPSQFQKFGAAKKADHDLEVGDGDVYWAGEGNGASGILAVCPKTGNVCLAWRSKHVQSPNCWGTIGGAVQKGMSPQQSARAELREETGYSGGMNLIPAYVFTDRGFTYHNYIGVTSTEFSFNPQPFSEEEAAEIEEMIAENPRYAHRRNPGWETTSLQWSPYAEVVEDMKANPSHYHQGLLKLFGNSADKIEKALGLDRQEKQGAKVKTQPMSEEWRKSLDPTLDYTKRQDLTELHDKLLSFGGGQALIRFNENSPEEVQRLLTRGQFWRGSKARMQRGRNNRCHGNSVCLMQEGRGQVVNGYALSQDGLWRPHSWLVTPEGGLLETTVRRAAYYGAVLTLDEVKREYDDAHFGSKTALEEQQQMFPDSQSAKFQQWFNGSKVVDKEGKPLPVYHGTRSSVDFDTFAVDGPPVDDSDYEGQPTSSGSGADPTSMMGAHFAVEPHVANQFAEGKGWTSTRYEGEEPKPRVIQVFLRITNPKDFGSEHNLREFINQGKISGDALDVLCKAETGFEPWEEVDEVGQKAIDEFFQKYENDQSFRAEHNRYLFEQHRSQEGEEDLSRDAAYELAQQARGRLETAGHDGIHYKNVVEGGTAWIAFDPRQIKSAWAQSFNPIDPRFTASWIKKAAGFAFKSFKKMWHVGDMNPASKRNDSYEGAGLSVSVHPEDWMQIAEIGGDLWELTKPGNKFVNFHRLSKAQRQQIGQWGIQNGYVVNVQVWRATWYDSEREENIYSDFLTQQEAQDNLEGEGTVKSVKNSLQGTEKLKQRSNNPSAGDTQMAFDLLVTVYAEDELDCDGVWWEDTYDPENMSAPRGVIFPNKLSTWSKRKIDWDAMDEDEGDTASREAEIKALKRDIKLHGDPDGVLTKHLKAITSSDNSYYMTEGCGIFAVALAQLHPKGEISVIVDRDGEAWSESVPYELSHVYLSTPSANYDAMGARSVEQMANDFNIRDYSVIGGWDTKDFMRKFMGMGDKPLYGERVDVEEAKQIILANPEKYGLPKTAAAAKPSVTQIDALHHMAGGKPLYRYPGGFWTTEPVADKDAFGVPKNEAGQTVWHVPSHTVKAMETRGWIARANKYPEQWKDDRVITDAGMLFVINKQAALEPDSIDTDSEVEFQRQLQYAKSLGWRGMNPWYPETRPWMALRLYSDGWKLTNELAKVQLAEGSTLAELQAQMSKYDLEALRDKPQPKTIDAIPIAKKLHA